MPFFSQFATFCPSPSGRFTCTMGVNGVTCKYSLLALVCMFFACVSSSSSSSSSSRSTPNWGCNKMLVDMIWRTSILQVRARLLKDRAMSCKRKCVCRGQLCLSLMQFFVSGFLGEKLQFTSDHGCTHMSVCVVCVLPMSPRLITLMLVYY